MLGTKNVEMTHICSGLLIAYGLRVRGTLIKTVKLPSQHSAFTDRKRILSLDFSDKWDTLKIEAGSLRSHCSHDFQICF